MYLLRLVDVPGLRSEARAQQIEVRYADHTVVIEILGKLFGGPPRQDIHRPIPTLDIEVIGIGGQRIALKW